MNKKYIDELCKIYSKRDIKQFAYLVYMYKLSNISEMRVDEKWLLYEIGRNLKSEDLNYILSFLRSKDKNKIMFSANLLSNMFNLETETKEYIKKCITDAKNLEISSRCITKLLKSVNEPNFLEECVKNSKSLGIDSIDLCEILKSSKNIEFMKYCIENSVEIGLFPNEIISVVNEIMKKSGEDNYTIHCIENWKKLNLNSSQVTNLLLNIKDFSEVINFIEHWKEYGLNSYNVTFIVKNSKIRDYEKSVVERAKEFELNVDNIYDIISSINDKVYMMKAIKSGALIGLDSYSIGKLIYDSKDKKFIKECLKISKNLNLNCSEIELLESLYNQLSFLKFTKHRIMNIIKSYKRDYKREVQLPPYMTFGIEIESIGQLEKEYLEKILRKMGDWHCKSDESLLNNPPYEEEVEIVSPVLYVNGKNPTMEIRNICALLNYFGQYSDESCGGHIHIGGKYLQSVDAYKNLLELWSNTEKILYLISNEPGTISRHNIDTYALPISKDLTYTLETGTVNLSNEDDLDEFKNNLRKFEENRFKGLNLTNMATDIAKIKNLPTIEFRASNGTVNADTWIENINLFGGLIKTSEDLARIKNKRGKIRKKEKVMLEQFEKLKSKNITETEKLETLLNLIVPKELKEIYILRYKQNSNLLKENTDLMKYFNENITNNPINIPRKENKLTHAHNKKHSKAKLEQEEDNEYVR